MTQETMTNDDLIILLVAYKNEKIGTELICDTIQQQLSAERERLERLIKNEPVAFFLVNIMRSLPNEKWPDLINALNERCSLPTAERERAGKMVEALKRVDALSFNPTVNRIIKQTLNEYDTATKESRITLTPHYSPEHFQFQ